MPNFNDRRPATPPEARVTKGYAALWHGGSSYGEPYEDSLEHFATRSAAKAEFRNRRQGQSRQQMLKMTHDGVLVHSDVAEAHTPAVDESSRMDLHPIKADGTYDRDVFHRMEFGKRGGIKGQWS